MESVTHVSHSRWLCPGWTPTVASKMASLVHIPETQARSEVAGCVLCPPGGPIYHLSHDSIQSSEEGFQVVYPLGLWSRFSGVVKVRFGHG